MTTQPKPPQRSARHGLLHILAIAAWLVSAPAIHAAEGIAWRTGEKTVDADVRDWELPRLLEAIATATGWEIFLEPGTTRTVTAAFKKATPDEALKNLLANVNYALVPQTNGAPRLYVFRTVASSATQLVSANPKGPAGAPAKLIANELVVTLKPGAKTKIEDLARLLGAKVVGRLDGLNAYRLQFDTTAAAQAARDALAQNSDVNSVDANFAIDRPPPVDAQLAGDAPVPKLRLNPPPSDGRTIVGLIDTAMQPLVGNLNSFLLPGLSVAGDPGQLPNSPTHGTAMAETILRALALNGQGSSATMILPVDVYGPNAMTTTFDVASGIYKAVNGGANLINLSLGSSGDSAFLHDLIRQAAAKGIVFFAAAGNEPVTTPTYPAAYPEVTAVTAGDKNGNIATYANHGSFVDVVAPGNSLVHYNGQTYFVAGTSTAAAFASGLTAARAEQAQTSIASAAAALRQSGSPATGTK